MVKKIKAAFIHFFSRRGLVLILFFAALSAVLVLRLFQLQVLNGKKYADSFTVMTTATRTLKSTRGNIYDVNGKLLAGNKLANNVTIEDNGTYNTTREKNLALNGVIYRLTQMIRKNGDTPSHDFHIIIGQDGNYSFDTDGTTTIQRFRADIYGYQTTDELKKGEVDASADKIISDLSGSDYYGLTDEDEPYTSDELAANGLPEELTKQEALDIIVVRYQLSLVSYQRYVAVTVATNVSDSTVAAVKENADSLQGVQIAEDYIRVYNGGESMSPILGYTGKISTDELKDYSNGDDRYNSNSIVGKAGIEKAMESTLQGKDGSEEITINNLGKVVSENTDSLVQPSKGNDVYLTIDSELQQTAYQILEERIAGIILINLTDAKSVDASKLADNDTISIASYDCYNALIENNIIDIDSFTDDDASENEKKAESEMESKQTSILNWITDQLGRDDATKYTDLSDEQKAFFDYVITDFLKTEYGILDTSSIDTSDATYQAYFTDGSISPRAFLAYAANNNWISVSKLSDEDSSYLTSDEIYQAVVDFITSHITTEKAFHQLLYKYMLQDDEMDPKLVMQIMYDQGVLSTDDSDYASFESGATSAYQLLYNKIYNLEITPAMLALDPCSGSIVITDPDTGQVRACVSYPGYDSNKLANDMDTDYYNKLNTDLSTPFYNKATQQLTAPGSTFKPIMAAAGLTEGVIDDSTMIDCTGVFGKDIAFLSDSDRVACWNANGHGYLDVVGGITNSCNVFFCTVGFDLGLDSNGEYDQDKALAAEQKYAKMFGLDEGTGIEISESDPHVSDSLPIPSSIGQGTHQYTTTQLARYAATIASRGVCRDLTLLDKTTDTNGNTLSENQAKTLSTADTISDDTWNEIYAGMQGVVSNDTVVWPGFSDTITVYAKTGTAQESMLRADHGLVIGFTSGASDSTSYSDVAFAVRIANGYGSTNASLVARDTLRYYFNLDSESNIILGHANTDSVTKKIVAD
ncbi:MAG: penicillin-binding transpeptidase domain-containing protein [Bilifractor sp.]